AEPRASEVVQPRSDEVDRIPPALFPRARFSTGGLAAHRIGGAPRDGYADLQLAGYGAHHRVRFTEVCASQVAWARVAEAAGRDAAAACALITHRRSLPRMIPRVPPSTRNASHGDRRYDD